LSESIVGAANVKKMEPMMGGEDFAYYVQKVPGAFFFVGGGNPQLDAVYPHHHPKFDVDERSMIIAGKVFVAAVLDYLSNVE
jgi:amidohydrolase